MKRIIKWIVTSLTFIACAAVIVLRLVEEIDDGEFEFSIILLVTLLGMEIAWLLPLPLENGVSTYEIDYEEEKQK